MWHTKTMELKYFAGRKFPQAAPLQWLSGSGAAPFCVSQTIDANEMVICMRVSCAKCHSQASIMSPEQVAGTAPHFPNSILFLIEFLQPFRSPSNGAAPFGGRRSYIWTALRCLSNLTSGGNDCDPDTKKQKQNRHAHTHAQRDRCVPFRPEKPHCSLLAGGNARFSLMMNFSLYTSRVTESNTQ